MITSATDRMPRVAALLERVDHWHVGAEARPEDRGTKEWQHFCVFSREIDLLINFSVMDGIQSGSDPSGRVARVAVIARTAGRWLGFVSRVPASALELRAGRIAGRFGESFLEFREGRYQMGLRSEPEGIEATLEFLPMVTPAITDPQPLGRGGTMRWLVVPRLRASGQIRVGGRKVTLRGEAAYHDHDWGVFRWGEGFTWNWAVALPDDPNNPWAMAATQIGDDKRAHRFANSFLLWRHDRLCRAIRGPGIETSCDGLLRPDRRPSRFPPVMALASPGDDVDIPARYEVRTEERGDRVELCIELDDYAQIAIPNDAPDWGTTLLSECRGRAHARGRVRGERLHLEGPALLEMVHVRP